MDNPDQALARFRERLASAPRVWVGYSGGLDSHVLLLAAHRLLHGAASPDLHALHVHHGLHADADHWTAHCAQVCEEINVPMTVIRVDGRDHEGLGPERAAREARYRAFAQVLGTDEYLLTAHHQNDQAETLLLQLLRGAGPDGLAAMPVHSELAKGMLLRPFLDISREVILSFASEQDLQWLEDSSNADLGLDRNYLRHRVIPLLKQRWPGLDRTTARSARLCAQTSKWVEQQTRALLDDQPRMILAIDRIREQTPFGRSILFRAWLKRGGLSPPSSQLLDEMIKQCLSERADATPMIRFGDHQIRRYRGLLYLMPRLPELPGPFQMTWKEQVCELPHDLGKLRIREATGAGIARRCWRAATPEVRSRTGGEKIIVPGRMHHTSLKHLFQEAGIPPWIRDRTPFIYINDELAAVGDRWVHASFAAQAGESGLLVTWEAPWRSKLA